MGKVNFWNPPNVIERDYVVGLGSPNEDKEIHYNLEYHVCLWVLWNKVRQSKTQHCQDHVNKNKLNRNKSVLL